MTFFCNFKAVLQFYVIGFVIDKYMKINKLCFKLHKLHKIYYLIYGSIYYIYKRHR